MSFQIGVLDTELMSECLVTTEGFSVGYQAHKVYLGRNITLPQDVTISMTMHFATMEKLREFFVFWETKTLNGAKPFYIKLPLFGDPKHYLILLDGEITQSHSPTLKIAGKYTLYRNRTLDENIPPVINDMSISVDMDSTNNYVFVPVDDAGDEVTYSISTQPINGVVTIVRGGAFYYSPTDGYSGADSFEVTVVDSVGANSTATVAINIINWQSLLAFKWGLTDDKQSFIDYSNETLITQPTKDDLATLANAVITYSANGHPQIDYSACAGIVNISFDNDGHMLIETIH